MQKWINPSYPTKLPHKPDKICHNETQTTSKHVTHPSTQNYYLLIKRKISQFKNACRLSWTFHHHPRPLIIDICIINIYVYLNIGVYNTYNINICCTIYLPDIYLQVVSRYCMIFLMFTISLMLYYAPCVYMLSTFTCTACFTSITHQEYPTPHTTNSSTFIFNVFSVLFFIVDSLSLSL